jgi:hypothetical protein
VRTGRVRALPAVLAAALVLVTACAGRSAGPAGAPAAPGPSRAAAPAPAPAATTSATPARLPPAGPVRPATRATASPSPSCPYPSSGFDCDLQRRIAAAESYADGRPGITGIVVRDRTTGAVWRNEYADTHVWTASTIKLAMAVDLLTRERAGLVHLTAADRSTMDKMLKVSDDDAADTLWFRYGGPDYATRFPAYGLTSVTFVSGFQHYWGWMKCTAADLDRLIRYVLERMPAADRAYLVDTLRAVGANQQWGVWGAGPAARPGNKDGWSLEQGGWVINSVGFVGPGERYTLAMMNSLRGEGGYAEGVATDTHIAALLFAGRF